MEASIIKWVLVGQPPCFLGWTQDCTYPLFCREDQGRAPLCERGSGGIQAPPWVQGPNRPSTPSGSRAHCKPPSQEPSLWNSLGPVGTCSQACRSCFQHKHIPAPLKQILFPSENKATMRGCISAQQVGIKQNHRWSQHYTVKRSSIITENSWIMFQDIELQNFRAGKEIRYY